jgi:DNA-binding MarR family transcriptional regulator
LSNKFRGDTFQAMATPTIYELMGRIALLLRSEERRLAGEFGLQSVQLEALRFLANCNRYSDTPTAVTEYLRVTKGTASQTIRVLKNRGLVSTTADPNDRRVQHLKPTPEGLEVLASCCPPPQFAEAVSGLSDDGGPLAVELVTLLRGLQESNRFRPFGVCGTCQHLLASPDGEQTCGLTREKLTAKDTTKLCREFATRG